jgi:hypothetical protein
MDDDFWGARRRVLVWVARPRQQFSCPDLTGSKDSVTAWMDNAAISKKKNPVLKIQSVYFHSAWGWALSLYALGTVNGHVRFDPLMMDRFLERKDTG